MLLLYKITFVAARVTLCDAAPLRCNIRRFQRSRYQFLADDKNGISQSAGGVLSITPTPADDASTDSENWQIRKSE